MGAFTPIRRAGARCAAVLLAALLGCAPSDPVEPSAEGTGPARTGRPDLLLVSIDTLRADRLGCYGYGRKTSPRIDALAAGGTRFETVYSPMSTTGPAHATLFTSRHPLELGMVRNGLVLDAKERTLAETLASAGWATVGFASTALFDPRLGLDQGFEHWDADVSPYDPSRPEEGLERSATDTVDEAVRFLEASTIDRPLFLFVHFYDPHEPYTPPGAFATRFVKEDMKPRRREQGLYDGEVLYTDGEVGRLLDELDRLRTERPLLVALTADHGQAFWEHGWTGHNAFTYDEELRIPLILAGPGVPEGEVVTEPVHMVDVAPTLLGLLGVDDPERDTRRGLDLGPLLAGGTDAVFADRPLFLNRPLRPGSKKHAGRPVIGYGFGLRLGDWKYFEAKDEGLRELYDLSVDPGEQRNLAEHRSDLADQYSAVIAHWLESMGGQPEEVDATLDPEVVESLRRLGYLGSDEE